MQGSKLIIARGVGNAEVGLLWRGVHQCTHNPGQESSRPSAGLDSKVRTGAASFAENLRSLTSSLVCQLWLAVDCHPHGTGWGPEAPFGAEPGRCESAGRAKKGF